MVTIAGVGGVYTTELGGYGCIRLHTYWMEEKITINLSGVTYAPSCGVNLLSIRALDRLGGRTVIEGVVLTVTLGGITIGSALMDSVNDKSLYYLETHTPEEKIEDLVQAFSAFKLTDNQATKLWHARTAHLSEANLKRLAHISTGMDLTKPPNDIHKKTCDICEATKMTAAPHDHPIKPGTRRNELIHSDISGPYSDPAGQGGILYVLTFMDDFTGYSDVYFLKHKSEATQCFKAYFNANNSSSLPFSRFKSDNGGEYINHAFAEFLMENGIIYEPTAPYNPQQNPRAERLGAILWMKANAIRAEAKLPKKWWPEFVRTANYLRNKGPIAGQDITPFQAKTGIVPDISHFKTPGCTAWVKLSLSNKKLSDKAFRAKFVGYEGNSGKNYRLIKPGPDGSYSSGTIVRSPHVHFSEEHLRRSPPPPYPDTSTAEHPEGGEVNVIDSLSSAVNAPQRPHARGYAVSLASSTESAIVIRDDDDLSAETNDSPADISASNDRPHTVPRRKTVLRNAAREAQRTVANANDDKDGFRFDKSGTRIRPIASDPEPRQRFDRRGPPQLIPSPLRLGPGEVRIMMRNGTYEDAIQVGGFGSNAHKPPNYPNDRLRHRALLTYLLHCAPPVDDYEPTTYNEAVNCDDADKWTQAMHEEHDSLTENGTWDLVDHGELPLGTKILKGKWVYKLKRGSKGEITRHKARWVARGYEQVEGIDYHETFASVVKPMSYKALFALAAALDWEIEQMDVKTAFLYGDIDEAIYIDQPPGCDDGSGRVCRLNKTLYGLKQSPRIWYNTLATFLGDLGFKALDADNGIFSKGRTFVAVYVDDLLIVGPHIPAIDALKQKLSERFQMSDLGACSYYLGMEVIRDRPNRILRLGQTAYVQRIVKDFAGGKKLGKRSVPIPAGKQITAAPEGYRASMTMIRAYQSAVGSLMYAMLGTRPDIAYAVSVVSRYAHNPTNEHWNAVTHIFEYLNNTSDLQLTFCGPLQELNGYSDADWAGDPDTRRSTGGYTFNLGSAALSWASKRQSSVALSSCEAEYMAQTEAIKEAIWLREILKELYKVEKDVEQQLVSQASVIYCDNQAAIALAKNPQYHARSKHIAIRYHWQREVIKDGHARLEFIPTGEQVADGLTKALPEKAFKVFRRSLGLEDRPGAILTHLLSLLSISRAALDQAPAA